MEINEHIESRRYLNVAFVRVITGLNLIDGIFAFKINCESFKVRIEEMCCMENEHHLLRGWDSDLDSDVVASEEVGSVDIKSTEDCMGRPLLLPVEGGIPKI